MTHDVFCLPLEHWGDCRGHQPTRDDERSGSVQNSLGRQEATLLQAQTHAWLPFMHVDSAATGRSTSGCIWYALPIAKNMCPWAARLNRPCLGRACMHTIDGLLRIIRTTSLKPSTELHPACSASDGCLSHVGQRLQSAQKSIAADISGDFCLLRGFGSLATNSAASPDGVPVADQGSCQLLCKQDDTCLCAVFAYSATILQPGTCVLKETDCKLSLVVPLKRHTLMYKGACALPLANM